MKKFYLDSLKRKSEVLALPNWGPIVSARQALTTVKIGEELREFQEMDDIRDWCEDNFGDNWTYSFTEFFFKYPEDAQLFTMRWL